MNQVFRPFNGHFSVVYFGDILVDSQSEDEHLVYITQVMKTLEEDKLYRNLKNCTLFHSSGHFFRLHYHGLRREGG